jgi:hypothetical protein
MPIETFDFINARGNRLSGKIETPEVTLRGWVWIGTKWDRGENGSASLKRLQKSMRGWGPDRRRAGPTLNELPAIHLRKPSVSSRTKWRSSAGLLDIHVLRIAQVLPTGSPSTDRRGTRVPC